MASKLQEYRRMSEEAQRQLTGSLERWQSFLATASRLYKYPYHEQVMIHAQRPDATACAEFEVWNNTMRRYVQRGSKGIALIDTSGDRERLRYVFDVSDTGTRPNSRSLNLWELREKHIPTVSSMLEKNYGVPAGESLAAQLEAVASQLAREYWEDNRRDILGILEDSFLEEYDEFNVGAAFRNAAEVSISYSLMLRCGLEPENYFEHEDFMSVFDFNTPETAGALGTAVSGINQQVLREIGAAIRNYEREQIAERSMAYGNDVQAERRLSDPGHQAERTGDETHREIRTDEEAVSAGASPDPLEPSGAFGTVVSALGGDRRDGAPEAGRADAAAGEAGRRDGGIEAQRPAEMGGHDEYAEGAGRGDHSERAGVQLTAGEPEPPEKLNSGYPAETEYEQLSLNLFLSEQEQISQIDEADRTTEVPSAFSFTQSEIDDVLRFGSNTSHAREHIADAFQKQKPFEEIAVLLQREFHGGYGIRGEHGDYAAWYDRDGIHLHKGRDAKYAADSQIIAWEATAERIGQLLEEGSFASNVELAEAGGRVRSELAQSLLYLKHDLSEEAGRLGYFSSMDDLPVGYPDATAALAQRMTDSTFADTLRGEFLTFLNDYAENRGLLRFHYHRMDELWQGLKDISAERRVYPDSLSELIEPQSFITEDEISEALTVGSSVEGGKGRIYAFFTADHTMKEKADFLKQEYGIGGRSHALSGADHSSEEHSAKGIKLTKGGCTPVELNWTKVAERITSLIRKDRYFTQEQKDAYKQMHNEPEISEAEEPVPEESVSEPAAAPKPVSADEISDALVRWNGSFESKSRVNDYMLAHGRERGAAAWLKDEFGGGETFSVITAHGALELPWAKIQRQLGILVNDGRFFTEADRMLAQAEQISAQVAENDAMDVQPDIALPEDAESTEMESVPHFQDDNDLIGAELTLDGRRFAVDEVRDGRASLRDITFQNGTGFPIFRNESVETVRRLLYPEQTAVPQVNLQAELTEAELELLRPQLDAAGIDYLVANAGYNSRTISFSSEHYREVQDMLDALPENADEVAYSTETDKVYPGEQTGLPYDIVTERLRTEPEHTPSVPDARNFRITDSELGVGGAKTKYQANINAIRLLKQLEAEGLQASHEQQEVLSRYVGWGGLADAFDPDKENWRAEYAELKELLTPEEYEAARASTLNAHYTSPTVIHAMYEALENMGFESGNILEPSMGVGNFFGCLPESMQNSRLYGVELDSITGRIAKKLYPKADITVAGFETTDRRDFFDVAIGNVPFGQYQVNDRAYNKLGFSIHDYFFAKTLDQVRPGGVIAFITSRYTMDKQSPEVRKYIAQRAELLGAIRLPNNAFKANAGTDVVSDIIFLQRRDRPIEIEPDWVHLGRNEDGFAINSYFVEHPEMILGRQSSESTQYGRQDFTVEPIEGLELADQLHDAVKYIRGTYQAAELPELGDDEALSDSIPADPNVKNYSYTVVDGEVYYRQNSLMSRPELNATASERVKGLVELRDCLHNLIDLQMDAMTPDSAIRQAQAELNTLYDSFAAKYGLINSRANALAFQDDSSYYLLCTLEELDEEKQLKRKADIFTKRTIKPHEVVTSVDTPSEALALSISEKACVDLPYMEQLTGMDESALIAGLQGVIFRDPVKNEWQTADEYLSGNVRQKLREAEQAAAADPAYLPNVEALRASQPKDLDASEIEVRLGATWIDQKYIQQFMEETFEPPFYLRRNIQVHFSPFTAEWSISGKSSPSYSDVNAYMTYGTERANAYKILEDTLNLRDVRIYDTVTDPDGKERRVLNSKETTLAQQKQQAIRDAFQEWIWRDPDRRAELVQRYNELFNSNRPREYDGSHITFSGMNPEIHLREHQLNAVAHILYGGNTLLAHEVGAGKTFEMVAAAMESKRLGLCHKPMFVVPNHLTEQWASEFLRLYPSANILAATKKDFEPKNRKKFCARIATGDYDAIIIGHSQFERIPVSMERQERLLREQIEEVTEGIEELKSSRAERFTIKSMERTKKGLETKLKKLLESGRKDDVVTFEELGVDRLYVDEAHAFKNLFLYTKMRNVAGLSTTDAQKSSDMLLKCRYIDELTGGKGVVFATGTPVSNSMTELYTMMRYLQHDTLRKKGMAHFDCWASTFGETTTAIELAPEGTGYRARTRFAKFFNLPELMTLFKEVADIKTSDQLHLPVPEAVYHNVVAQPTEIQQAMVQELSERAARVHAGAVDASVDNMLRITTDGRKLGLDQRIINPDLPDAPSSKVNMCVENIYRIWDEGQADRLTQLVFCDLSTPKAGAPSAKAAKAVGGNLDNPELHAIAGSVKDDSPEPEFTVYDDIREKLVSRGIPREQIAFIHEANTEARKKELFAKVRSGQVRVLMGSTFKMGAGMNVQDRLVALHDLDAPWRPGDLEQRSGRIIRQGNRNKKVHIFRYVTEATFDAYLWQTLENKQKFISQIMTSKSSVRSCEDIDETALSYAEIKALCAGDERIKEKMDLDVDVARLKLMKANHQSQQYRLEDNILRHFPEQIEQNKGFIAGVQADMQTLAEHPHPQDGFAGMVVRGDVLTDKENAGAALVDAMKEIKGLEPVPIGSYRGFQMSLTLEDFGKQYVLTLKGKMSHRVELGRDPRGNLIRIDNALAGMETRLARVQEKLDSLYAQMETAKAELGKPFPQEQELKEKSARLAQLNIELNIDDRTPIEAMAEVSDDEPEVRPAVSAKSERSSVLAKLHAPLPQRNSHLKQNETEKEVR
jgi:N12 class adenine-specific DNA methylase